MRAPEHQSDSHPTELSGPARVILISTMKFLFVQRESCLQCDSNPLTRVYTVKILTVRTPEKFVVITLKFK